MKKSVKLTFTVSITHDIEGDTAAEIEKNAAWLQRKISERLRTAVFDDMRVVGSEVEYGKV